MPSVLCLSVSIGGCKCVCELVARIHLSNSIVLNLNHYKNACLPIESIVLIAFFWSTDSTYEKAAGYVVKSFRVQHFRRWSVSCLVVQLSADSSMVMWLLKPIVLRSILASKS